MRGRMTVDVPTGPLTVAEKRILSHLPDDSLRLAEAMLSRYTPVAEDIRRVMVLRGLARFLSHTKEHARAIALGRMTADNSGGA